jgi:ABC-type branched-subunit amino acid transport system ATPase component
VNPGGPAAVEWSGELEIQGLTVAYGSHSPAVTDFSARVLPGTTLALLGSNGAGKSTVLRAVGGLLPLHGGRVVSGSVSIGGEVATAWSAARRVRAGLAQSLEGRRVFTQLTVEENLRAGAVTRRGRGAVEQGLDSVFARFPELVDRRHTKAGLLSGGQQQMLAIGRALMAAPRVVLLDEPSLGLAPKLIERVAETIREIQRDGISVLLIEQNVAMSLELADYAIVLESGRIAIEGTAADLAVDPRVQAAYLGGHAGAGTGDPAGKKVGLLLTQESRLQSKI